MTGYQRTWALSVVRGADHLTGVVTVGPSFQSVVVSETSDVATIEWSPAHEPGISSEACATYALPAQPADRCHEGNDEGFVDVGPGAKPDGAMVLRETKGSVRPWRVGNGRRRGQGLGALSQPTIPAGSRPDSSDQYLSWSFTQLIVPSASLRPLGARSSQFMAPIKSSVPRW